MKTTKNQEINALYGKAVTSKDEALYLINRLEEAENEALLYLINRLEEAENEINNLREINLSLMNETVSQEIKLSEVRDFIKKHRRTIDNYYIYDPADSHELKLLSDIIY